MAKDQNWTEANLKEKGLVAVYRVKRRADGTPLTEAELVPVAPKNRRNWLDHQGAFETPEAAIEAANAEMKVRSWEAKASAPAKPNDLPKPAKKDAPPGNPEE